MPPIQQQITFLYTADLQATDEFYQKIMGLPLAVDQGACRIYRVTPQSYWGFCAHLQEMAHPENIILTLVTPAVDEWYQHLMSKGVHFESPPHTNPKFNIYHCFLRDPNNYRIEIQYFLHPFGEIH